MGEGTLIVAFFCPKCGFRGVDVFPEKGRKGRRLVLRVDNRKKLNVLVVRSSTATVKIPEIGAEIKPGPAATGFITTVEGILLRFLEVFHGNKAAEGKIRPLLNGREFTLIIEDPMGTSGIDCREVEEEELS